MNLNRQRDARQIRGVVAVCVDRLKIIEVAALKEGVDASLA